MVAQPDPKWGETPCAFVELKPGAAVTEEEIIAHCREHLARFKAPKRVMFGELPKTSTGKIQKFLLRERGEVGERHRMRRDERCARLPKRMRASRRCSLRSVENGVATLTLNRPRQFNAISVAMLDALQAELDAIGADPPSAWSSSRGRAGILGRPRPEGDDGESHRVFHRRRCSSVAAG